MSHSISDGQGAFQKLWSSPAQREALLDYWRVYEQHYDDIGRETRALAADHPVFGAILRGMTEEALARSHKESREILERAMTGEWAAYEANLRMQGAAFARMGVGFSVWYDLVRTFQRLLVPALIEAYHAERGRLAATLNAMQDFVDRAMATIAEEYLETKEAVIREQRTAALRRAEELSRSEAAVRSQTAILDSVLQSLRDGVVVVDAAGNLILRNAAAERMMGHLTLESFSNSHDYPFRHADGVTRIQPEERPLFRATRGEGTDDLEMVLPGATPEASVITRVDGRPMRDPSGAVTGGVVTFRDVSELRRMETVKRRSAELEMQNTRIQEANRLKSEFLANMSHELRTPLNSIIGFGQLLHDGDVPSDGPEHTEFLGNILRSARHLLKLINDVLDLAKVEAGKMEFHPERLEVVPLVGEVVGIVRTLAAAKRIRVIVEVDPKIHEIDVDEARFKQILYNYLSNAIKFTPEGGQVTVRVDPDGPARFQLAVTDTGIGIAPEDLGKLFVEFQQLDGGTGKKHGGTGLGLALTRKLVEAQGGEVGVESRVGHGSTFFARLARSPGVRSPAPQPRNLTRPAPGRPTVLVIEDDPRDQAALVQALSDAGYGVVAAPNGRAALALSQERTFDAITLDLLLPDMSGFEVLSGIRAQGRNAHAPIVVVTVVTEAGVTGHAVHDFLPKPLEGNALLSALARAGVVAEQPGDVLVIDDDPASLRLMEAALAQLGHGCIGATDAVRALEALERTQPVAIVLDLNLPGIDGFTLLDLLRSAPRTCHTPVIIWTVRDLSDRERARLQGSARAIVLKGQGGARSLVDELRGLLPPGSQRGEARHGR